ncbi:hypothetical protein [uncultured Sphingomonas sp.]|uniref:hypothetical protein n=1 Tax=uncultured Sphingomonas sp. TaxID=158754 RepID=UPI0035CA6D9B
MAFPLSARRPTVAVAAALLAASAPAQTLPPPSAGADAPTADASAVPYAFYADLVLAAPVIVDATIRSAARIKGVEAASVAPGLTRYYVEADVGALIRGADGLPTRIGWLVDAGAGRDGRPLKLKKARVLVFGRIAPGAAGPVGQVQLVSPDAQVDWSAQADALVRRIARAAVAPDAPPRITGVGRAFHVPGSLPGESETQVFLTTADARPVSLSILRRPGERPSYAVALSEIVDEAAGPPPRDTLLWYRLACFLPRTLPGGSTASLESADADAARADYRFVLAQLGACGPRAFVASRREAPVQNGDASPPSDDRPTPASADDSPAAPSDGGGAPPSGGGAPG